MLNVMIDSTEYKRTFDIRDRRKHTRHRFDNIFSRFSFLIPFFVFVFFLFVDKERFIKDGNIQFDYASMENKPWLYPKGRVFDVWMYSNEAQVAYVRLWRLYDYVDKFIIVVSHYVHSGKRRKISFKPYEKEIEKYKDKIEIVYAPHICDSTRYYSDKDNWCKEKTQRDYGLTYIEMNHNPGPDDIILVSDADEIFTRDAVERFKRDKPDTFYYVSGVTYFPYYFHRVDVWNVAFVLRYTLVNYSLSQIRNNGYMNKENIYGLGENLVTHCTYCFESIEQYRDKLKSFAHVEFNNFPFTSDNFIFKSHYCREKINSLPGYDENMTDWSQLIPNDERLRYLYDPSFEYSMDHTSYTQKDLKTLCDREYRRTPFK